MSTESPTEPAAAPQRTTPASRVEGLPANAIRFLQIAARNLDLGRIDDADAALRQTEAIAAEHPEVLRLRAVAEYRRRRYAEAVDYARRALKRWPDDALALGNLGSALAESGRVGEALAALRRACDVAPGFAGAWFNYGKLLDSQAYVAEAEAALARAVALAPAMPPARVAHASTLVALGRVAEAAAEYRAAIASNPRAVQAWLGLANLKTVRLDENELAALERLHADASLGDDERAVAGFALGQALEDAGRHADAFGVLTAANALRRRGRPWDASAFARQIDAVESAFASELPAPVDPALGEPVVFVVSLPRSGSTLVEQILAAHRDVEGASELPDLEAVILEESLRRGEQFPHWVHGASAAHWQRMGQRYLERTARWRKHRPRFTDKMPDNWLLAGAALAMLPGARVVNVRRDAVETCWSCFKQLFASGRHLYSYDLADLAETWRGYDRLSAFWSRRFPDRVREQSYERLVAEPEAETRALLDFCGLDFDPACLEFHAAGRSVRTASAAQVREPMRKDTARSGAYGERLAPLRRMLEGADDAATPSPRESDAPKAERVRDLDPSLAQSALRAAALVAGGRADEAKAIMRELEAARPDHPETLRLAALAASVQGRHVQALEALAKADAAKPGDALIHNTLGTIQAASGDAEAAFASFSRASELDPSLAGAQHNLGNALLARGDAERAREHFERAVASEPAFVPARVALARTLQALGDDDAAAAHYRRALADDPHAAAAWQGLAELRPAEFSAAERAALENEYRRPQCTDAERAALGFAFANVMEARAQYPEAFTSGLAANALRRRASEWSAERRTRHVERMLEAFASPVPAASDASLGERCIVVLGLPEHAAASLAAALRAHRDLSRAPLPNPARTLAAESARRGRKLPDWAREATPSDWERLGRAYLASTPTPRGVVDAASIDVAQAGAVAAMLPSARFVAIRRDPLDACWSCFRQDLPGHRYAADFAELVAYWRDDEKLIARWRELFSDRLLFVDYDALRDDPAGTFARVLAHAGLDGDAEADARLAGLLASERTGARAYGDLIKPFARMVEAAAAESR